MQISQQGLPGKGRGSLEFVTQMLPCCGTSLATEHEELCDALGVGQTAVGKLPQRLRKGDQEAAGELDHCGSHVVPGQLSVLGD